MSVSEILSKIDRCHAEIRNCQAASADMSQTEAERVGAQRGECDFWVELRLYEAMLVQESRAA